MVQVRAKFKEQPKRAGKREIRSSIRFTTTIKTDILRSYSIIFLTITCIQKGTKGALNIIFNPSHLTNCHLSPPNKAPSSKSIRKFHWTLLRQSKEGPFSMRPSIIDTSKAYLTPESITMRTTPQRRDRTISTAAYRSRQENRNTENVISNMGSKEDKRKYQGIRPYSREDKSKNYYD